MQKKESHIIYSPSDVVVYFKSPFASWMDRYYLEYRDKIKCDELGEYDKFIIDLGFKHEKSVLEKLLQQSPVVKIDTTNKNTAREATKIAIASKKEIVFQPFLEKGCFAGFADFIVFDKIEGYHIWDAKLAFNIKPHYLLQLCCYADMLQEITGYLSKKIVVASGDGSYKKHLTKDFIFHYYEIRDKFLDFQSSFSGELGDCPLPQRGEEWGRWKTHAENILKEKDDLSQVARISNGQIVRLKKAGVETLKDLADYKGPTPAKMKDTKLQELITQAQFQVTSRERQEQDIAATPAYKVIKDSLKGLNSLPLPSDGDVFFDIEGYPLVTGGLEYLFGACGRDDDGELSFFEWWAHDKEEEKKSFESFIDWIFKRWSKYPDMHIYHYAQYEITAVRKLSTRYGTREKEVDDLLRNEIFVDLYRIIKHGMIVGTKGYSIKDIELLYRNKRSTEVASGADSIVQYARWKASKESKDPLKSGILSEIRSYNIDDCYSTAELVAWLYKVAEKNCIKIGEKESREIVKDNEDSLTDHQKEVRDVVQKLKQKEDKTSSIVADLLEFHNREEKVLWWNFFDALEKTESELYHDSGSIVGVIARDEQHREARSLVQPYCFDALQNFKFSSSGRVKAFFQHLPNTPFTVTSSSSKRRDEICLKISEKKLQEELNGEFPKKGNLILLEHISAGVIQQNLLQQGKELIDGKISRVAAALLLSKKPPLNNTINRQDTVSFISENIKTFNGDYLLVQGPPGTGKTYTASRVIANLLNEGKKIGIVSNSHKAINNLLEATISVSKNEHSFLKVGGDRLGEEFSARHLFLTSSTGSEEVYDDGVVAGTTWLFSRHEWREKLDFLFVDEAGQVSLANAVALARCCKNMVLLGDQMQLQQPIQGSHPGDSGLSVLQYILKEESSDEDNYIFRQVVAPDKGVFLSESRRMSPALCRFVSATLYDDKLTHSIICAQQKVVITGEEEYIKKESGIIFSNVNHIGNTQKSDEEAKRVAAIFKELIGKECIIGDKTKILKKEDFLFITPFNAQVKNLEYALPQGVRIGSVDKFQGQQAPVCILSLTLSAGEEGSRGVSFVLDPHRINVAISRAQCLSVVVGSKDLLNTTIKNISDIKLLNLFARIIKEGS